MKLVSTRNNSEILDASLAVLKGIAPDGGLYVPTSYPKLDSFKNLQTLTYPQLAANVLSNFFDMDDLGQMTQEAYAGFDHPEKAPLKKVAENQFVLELYHGPTLAFKDMALSVLPRLMTSAMKQQDGKDVLILVATSGDTGKAALEGFCNVAGTRIIVFYPSDGVSDMQKLQMVTQEGENTHVCAVLGNFDDAQYGVKSIFTDVEFAKQIDDKGYRLSSANSINFGRLAPQIAYYIWSYVQLLKDGEISEGEKINFVVPTGNFGNILAAYYAKRMGLPVGKLICASNKNNVLTDFFHSGEYSLSRDFYKTMSPSMDILISSNLERLLYEINGRDDSVVVELMDTLRKKGAYAIKGSAKEALEKEFYADWCDEAETMACIRSTFEQKGYLIDTHTAVAMCVAEKYKATGDKTKTVVVSTASPYKFPQDVLASLGEDTDGMTAFEMAQRLSEVTGTQVPKQIIALNGKQVLHKDVVAKDGMREAVLSAL